jgi:hypothetical protein
VRRINYNCISLLNRKQGKNMKALLTILALFISTQALAFNDAELEYYNAYYKREITRLADLCNPGDRPFYFTVPQVSYGPLFTQKSVTILKMRYEELKALDCGSAHQPQVTSQLELRMTGLPASDAMEVLNEYTQLGYATEFASFNVNTRQCGQVMSITTVAHAPNNAQFCVYATEISQLYK